MERENRASSAAAAAAAVAVGAYRLWETPPEDVIVVSSGRPPRHLQQPSEGAGQQQHQQYPEPPEKVYYKTKLCEKYVTMGHCMYEDGCTFAHGRAELRPPLPAHGSAWRRPPAEQEHARGYGGGGGGAGGGGGGVGRGKVCFMFREKRDCHYGDKCAFPHASAPGPEMRNYGEPKLTEARRSATLPARAFPAAAPRGRGYAPAPTRAFSPVVPVRQLPEEDGSKAGPLTLLSRRKTSGIYGDWPEEY